MMVLERNLLAIVAEKKNTIVKKEKINIGTCNVRGTCGPSKN